jgi:phosphoglycolate phosphatase
MKLIMFDYDGVLVDSFQMTKKIYLDVSREFNLSLPDDDSYFRELFELDWKETLKKLDLYTKEKVERIEEIYKEGLVRYEKDAKPYPKIAYVLETLSKRYTLAIVTNNIRKELDFKLSKYDLGKFFSATFTEEDGIVKPDPDLVIKCMKRFNAVPQDCAFVGDKDGDIIAAKAANVGKIVAVSYGFHLHHRLKNANLMVNAPLELLDAFS